MAFVKMNEMIIICNNQVHIKHKPRVNNLNNINLKYFFHPTLWVFFTVEKKSMLVSPSKIQYLSCSYSYFTLDHSSSADFTLESG